MAESNMNRVQLQEQYQEWSGAQLVQDPEKTAAVKESPKHIIAQQELLAIRKTLEAYPKLRIQCGIADPEIVSLIREKLTDDELLRIQFGGKQS